MLPPLIRKEFTGDIPEGLVKPDFGRQLHERGFNEVSNAHTPLRHAHQSLWNLAALDTFANSTLIHGLVGAV